MPLLSNARNTPKSASRDFLDLYEGIGVVRVTMGDDESARPLDVQPDHIHLFFSMEGDVAFQFGPMYMRPLPQGQSFFIYDPKDALRAQVRMPAGHRMVGIRLSFSRMHTLFMRDGQDAQELPFLNQKDMQRPIYDQRGVDAAMQILLEGLFHERLSPNAQRVALARRPVQVRRSASRAYRGRS